MKILLNNPVVTHGAFHHWMTADLLKLGHDVTVLDPDELCEQFGIELYRRSLFQRIEALQPEILFVYPPYDLLRPQDADRIRAMGTCIVGFAYDDPLYLPAWLRVPGTFEKILDEFRRTYDVYVTTSGKMVAESTKRAHDWIKLIKWAVNTPEDPGALNPDIPLLVIGAPYPRRVEMVRYLKRVGLAPIIFGIEGWKEFPEVADCYHGMLTRPGMFEMYRRAKIALAPADWASMHTPMVKLRTLEIASCACFQLCEAADDLKDYYADGKEIVTYKDWDHMAELIRHYLTHDDERQRIARGGFDRTVKDHVWTVRWDEIESQAAPVIKRLRAAAEPGPRDPDLAHELSLSSCALYHERFADYSTSLGSYDEWLKLSPDYPTALTGKARVLFQEKNYPAAEALFKQAVERCKGLDPLGIDTTVTRRNVGLRMGLGKLFSGIFPREIECYSYLFILYSLQNRESDAEALIEKLRENQDVLFVSLITIFAECKLDETLNYKFLARYSQVLLESKPFVWEGERQRHSAQLLLLRGQALANLGQRDAAIQALTQALSAKPHATLEAQIRQTFAAMGLVM